MKGVVTALCACALLATTSVAVGQTPATVHGGHAACYDARAWSHLEGLRAQRKLETWNEELGRYRERGVCWVTEQDEAVELAGADMTGAVLVRRRSAGQKADRRWAYLSTEAVKGGR